jgi:predicted protein tyrosine phosphatase
MATAPATDNEAAVEADEKRFVSISRIIPGLYLGNIIASYHMPTLQSHDIGAVVSLIEKRHPCWTTARFQAQIPSSDNLNSSENRHLFSPTSDSDTQDLLVHLQVVCDFIDVQRTAGRNVLVHCVAGVSRSPTVVAAYLMRKWGKGADKTLAYIAGKRREVRPSENFVAQLRVWEQVEWDVWKEEGDGLKVPKKAYREFLKGRAGVGEVRGRGKRMAIR